MDAETVAAARDGDRAAFDRLCRPALARLRAVVRRMIGDPTETDDLVQESLTRAWAAIRGFDGRSEISTWLCRIGINAAIDHLRAQRRWRARAQIAYANECATSADLGQEVGEALMSPSFRYDAREHIAFCFACVGRSLDPELQAALVLREIEGLSNLEAARSLDITESVLRHRLAEARETMEREFEGLCALVNKRGVCYQCSGLRDALPDDDRRGAPPPQRLSFDERLACVRAADVDAGASQPLHDLFWRRLREQEIAGRGSVELGDDCAPVADPE
jgi:RNA polymerase sigma-70 factor (ECF subfamily)